MSRQGLAQNEQKCQFRAKVGRFWAKNPFFYFLTSRSLWIGLKPFGTFQELLEVAQNDQNWLFGHFGPGLAGSFGALLVGWLVARGLYLAGHLFTLLIEYNRTLQFL